MKLSVENIYRTERLDATTLPMPDFSIGQKKDPLTVVKLGGDCMATSENVQRSVDIIHADAEKRRLVVVSAPGETEGEIGVTDLLFDVCDIRLRGGDYNPTFDKIRSRYHSSGKSLHEPSLIDGWMDTLYRGIESKSDDWVKSRGEWLMMHVFARVVGGSPADAANYIVLRDVVSNEASNHIVVKDKEILPVTYRNIRHGLPTGSGIDVMGGYYGVDEQSNEVVFPRGASDLTAAILAAGVNAESVEMYKNVPGILAAHPKVVENPQPIKELTFAEMREMSYRGADVLQRHAVLPVCEKEIPIFVNSLQDPEKGTKIVKERVSPEEERIIGISAKVPQIGEDGKVSGNFLSFRLSKSGMNEKKGMIREITEIFEKHYASIDYVPCGIDDMSVVVDKSQLIGEEKNVRLELGALVDTLEVKEDLEAICVVGQKISEHSTEVILQIASALDDKGINIEEFIHAGGKSMVFTVEADKAEGAMYAIYESCINTDSQKGTK